MRDHSEFTLRKQRDFARVYKQGKSKGGRFAVTEGILVGISSGAALCGAFRIAEKEENKRIVVLLADNGNRYFSTGVFD